MIEAKLQPHSSIYEERIIAAIVQKAQVFDDIVEYLTPESFYKPLHQDVIKACFELLRKREAINYYTIAEKISKDLESQKENFFWLSNLTFGYVAPRELNSYIAAVKDMQVKRDLIKACHETMISCYENEATSDDILQGHESVVFAIANQIKTNHYQHIADGAVTVIQKADEARTNTAPITGVDTGYLALNDATSGWQAPDLVILAARPSVGKTAFALNLAYNAMVSYYKPIAVGYFSLEMPTWQLAKRLMAISGKYTMTELSKGRGTTSEVLLEDAERLSTLSLWVDDTAGLNFWSLKNKAKRMVQREGVGMIIIDYLQLVTGDRRSNGNREQEISEISRGLKQLAKELNVPIIALSQLSRDVEKRGGSKIPQLSDLRESGAIEQDADMVCFIYGHSDEEKLQNADLANKKYLKIAKYRNGELNSFEFEADGQKQKWHCIGYHNEVKQLPTSKGFIHGEIPKF